jgi:hypothetical protein
VHYPVLKSEVLTVSPYAGNNFFFSLENGIGYDENRLYGGFTMKLCGHTTLDFYYMRLLSRSGSGGPWAGSNIIGTGITVGL